MFVNLGSLPEIEGVRGWPRIQGWLQLQARGVHRLPLSPQWGKALSGQAAWAPPSRASQGLTYPNPSLDPTCWAWLQSQYCSWSCRGFNQVSHWDADHGTTGLREGIGGHTFCAGRVGRLVPIHPSEDSPLPCFIFLHSAKHHVMLNIMLRISRTHLAIELPKQMLCEGRDFCFIWSLLLSQHPEWCLYTGRTQFIFVEWMIGMILVDVPSNTIQWLKACSTIQQLTEPLLCPRHWDHGRAWSGFLVLTGLHLGRISNGESCCEGNSTGDFIQRECCQVEEHCISLN